MIPAFNDRYTFSQNTMWADLVEPIIKIELKMTGRNKPVPAYGHQCCWYVRHNNTITKQTDGRSITLSGRWLGWCRREVQRRWLHTGVGVLTHFDVVHPNANPVKGKELGFSCQILCLVWLKITWISHSGRAIMQPTFFTWALSPNNAWGYCKSLTLWQSMFIYNYQRVHARYEHLCASCIFECLM